MATKGRRSGKCCVNLDRTVAFLSKRDGIDKVLKCAKYLSGLGLALRAPATSTPASKHPQLPSLRGHAQALATNASAVSSRGAAFGKAPRATSPLLRGKH